MKFLKLVLALFLSLLSANSFAKTMCICQTGSQPENQVKFFKAGCKTWFVGRSCDEKKTVSQDVDLFAVLSDDYIGGNLELGYVGHWSSSAETIKFLNAKIVPVAKSMNIDVNIDNTACSGMSNAFEVQDYLAAQKDKGLKNKITFQGNQITSIGMWNKFVPGNYNLPAVAGTELSKVTYPSCKKFAGTSCSSSFQQKEEGLCVDASQKLERLICLSVKKEVNESNERGDSKKIITHQEWVASTEAMTKYKLNVLDSNSKVVDIRTVGKSDKVIFKISLDDQVVLNTESNAYMIESYGNYLNRLNEGILNFEASMQKWNEVN